jgi:hypothetical protein
VCTTRESHGRSDRLLIFEGYATALFPVTCRGPNRKHPKILRNVFRTLVDMYGSHGCESDVSRPAGRQSASEGSNPVNYEGESVNRSQIEVNGCNGRNRFSMCITR